MSDWFFRQGGRDKLIDWLGIDSKIDSTIADTLRHVQEAWSAWSSAFARLRLTGWRRLANELVSEVVVVGAGGVLVLYALALPALLEFDEGKFLTGRYSVTFLDQAGNEIGKRGILHNDAIPLD
ncbi:MAG: penicillin-binding protein, partial [Gammaproteobacteria bacterium]